METNALSLSPYPSQVLPFTRELTAAQRNTATAAKASQPLALSLPSTGKATNTTPANPLGIERLTQVFIQVVDRLTQLIEVLLQKSPAFSATSTSSPASSSASVKKPLIQDPLANAEVSGAAEAPQAATSSAGTAIPVELPLPTNTAQTTATSASELTTTMNGINDILYRLERIIEALAAFVESLYQSKAAKTKSSSVLATVVDKASAVVPYLLPQTRILKGAAKLLSKI